MSYKLIFLDTETTGNMPEDRLCQICYKTEEKLVDELYNPGLPIKIEAMVVHHITNEMVQDKPAFKESPQFSELKKMFEDDGIFVAHNAKFDKEMVEKEGLSVGKVIDTYRVARHLDPDGKIPSYGLQYLRYFLGIQIEAIAHDAKGDVLVLEKLFERLIGKIMERENISKATAIEQMIDISARPVMFKFINFGKYKNQSLQDILINDRNYLEWLLEQKRQNPDDEEDWIYTLETLLDIK